MDTLRILCQHCSAPIKSRKPVPANTKVTCPRCRRPFVVSAVQAAPVKADPVTSPDDVDSAENQEPSAALRMALVGAGLAAVAGIGALLLYLGLRGDAKHTAIEPLPTPVPEVAPADIIVPPRPKQVKRLIDLSEQEEQTVKSLQAKGVAWLKKQQRPDGSFHDGYSGFSSLAALTLLECGVPASDPVLVKAANFIRKASLDKIDDRGALRVTYNVSLALLFLDRLNDAQDEHLVEALALRLIAGQTFDGGWGYSCPKLAADEAAALRKVLKDMGSASPAEFRSKNKDQIAALPGRLPQMTLLRERPLKNKKAAGINGPFNPWNSDNSNTQFALLALWNVRRHGVPVDPALRRVVQHFRQTQRKDGHWPYDVDQDNVNKLKLPSMTCAGVLGLAVGYGIDPTERRADWRQDAAIRKALQHISKSIGTPEQNPRAKVKMTDMYFLWSLERIGVLFSLSQIEGKDWYRWGLGILQSNQRDDGSWYGGLGNGLTPLGETAFALLFLNRSNLASDLTDKLEEVMQLAGTPAPARKQ